MSFPNTLPRVEWRAEFRLAAGHSWQPNEPKAWCRKLVAPNDQFVGLIEIAKQLKSAAPPDKLADKRYAFLRWLICACDPPGDPGNDLILNTIVTDRTLRDIALVITWSNQVVTAEFRKLAQGIAPWISYEASQEQHQQMASELALFHFPFDAKSKADWTAFETLEKHFSNVLVSLRMRRQFSVTSYSRSDSEIRIALSGSTEYFFYLKGSVCGCIPIPGQEPKLPGDTLETQREPRAVRVPEMVITSPVVRNALRSLARIWQDPFAKSVLISAPPGSGKEELSKSIPYGQGRPTSNMQTLSLADSDHRSVQKRLMGFQRDDGSIEDGLFEKARDSALFLDEVHQPGRESETRAALLRPLEAAEYYPVDGDQHRKIENVLFVLATSLELDALEKFQPRDFWTRMTHVVRLEHPLAIDDEALQKKVLGDFFNIFWWDRCESFYRERIDDEEEPANDPARLIKWRQLRAMYNVINPDAVNPFPFTPNFIKEFSTRLSPQKIQSFSIRGIRSVVSRLFSVAASHVAQGGTPWRGDVEFFKADANDTVEEIRNIANLAGTEPESVAIQPPLVEVLLRKS